MKVNRYEKRIFQLAILAVLVSLCLIGYATWGMGVNVPTCVPLGTHPFEQASITKHDAKNYEVHYVARMWAFEPSVLRVPTGSTLDIYAVTKDVEHGLFIAGTNVNLMLVPGAVANSRVHFDKPGVYSLICHEFCGRNHQSMSARIEVVDKLAEYSAEGLPADEGMKLLDAKGCLACHSTDGTPSVGPTLRGSWGTKLQFVDGTSRTLDSAFLREKLLRPTATTVKDFQPVMPETQLTDDEINQIQAYLEGLKN